MGLSYSEAMLLPFGQLQDLIAVFQIKKEGAVRKLTYDEEVDDFERLLSFR